jgi:hypothetical protein
MAGTASPRSELSRAAGLHPLRGGALQENWGLDAHFPGGTLDGQQQLKLRTSGAIGVASSLIRFWEFTVQKAGMRQG